VFGFGWNLSLPSIIALAGGQAQFMDLAGDGQPDLVTFRGATQGFYERTQDAGWENFVAFKSLPNLDWDNPNQEHSAHGWRL
jgi:hypothetical protein